MLGQLSGSKEIPNKCYGLFMSITLDRHVAIPQSLEYDAWVYVFGVPRNWIPMYFRKIFTQNGICKVERNLLSTWQDATHRAKRALNRGCRNTKDDTGCSNAHTPPRAIMRRRAKHILRSTAWVPSW